MNTVGDWLSAQATSSSGVPGGSWHKVITPTGQHMPGTRCLLSSSPQLSAQGQEPGRGEGAGVASVHRTLGLAGGIRGE